MARANPHGNSAGRRALRGPRYGDGFVAHPLTYFDPQPGRDACPARLPSPFAATGPHPIAVRAAEELRRHLSALQEPLGFEVSRDATRGKMFGVLVVADASGRLGYLRGFSGMLDGSWHRDGFVGPVFDHQARHSVWPAGEAELVAFDHQLDALAARLMAARHPLDQLQEIQAANTALMTEAHVRNRVRRREARAGLSCAPDASEPAKTPRAPDGETTSPSDAARSLQTLAEESRRDTAEERRHRTQQRLERELAAAPLRALQHPQRLVKATRAARSCELLEQLHAGYRIDSARGEVRSLRELFAPAAPPGGSADCAAPKLFAHARRTGLRPIALAEFWWGPPPVDGGRAHGHYYPSCHGKCGPVLRHMLDGLDGEAMPLFGAGAIPAEEPRTVYEDPWLVVVCKPEGLLSVPGRSALLGDAVSTRLAARYPGAAALMLVHRLDLDTSGLLLAAKDRDTYVALQRQFSEHAIEKRYVAWLDGTVAAERGRRGVIDLPLRVDLDDRPRQIFDPLRGKPAHTEWSVDRVDTVDRVDRAGGQRTRVLLFPRTGRTHQLRVHASHPRGLGVPIVGDRLYGHPGERLLLHAESLAFQHPHTGERIHVESAAPF